MVRIGMENVVAFRVLIRRAEARALPTGSALRVLCGTLL